MGRIEKSRQRVCLLSFDFLGADELYHDRGDSTAKSLVSTYLAILNKRIKKHEGQLIDAVGDSVLISFPSARKTLACAANMMRALQKHRDGAPPADRLQVRMGVHQGLLQPHESPTEGELALVCVGIRQQAGKNEIIASQLTWQAAMALDTEIDELGLHPIEGSSESLALTRIIWQADVIEQRRQTLLKDEQLPALAKSVDQSRCLLCLGGATLGQRKGSVRTLIARKMAVALGIDDRRIDPARLAARYEEEHDRQELERFVIEEVENCSDLQMGLLQNLAAIAFDLILTTDIDTRIESTLRATGRKVRVFYRIEAVNLSAVETGETALIKIFGDVQEPDTLALTEEDIHERLRQIEDAPEDLLGALATRHLLLLGFRWQDSRFKRLYKVLTANRDSGHGRAMGLSAKVSSAARGSCRRLGLHLSQADEIDFSLLLAQKITDDDQEKENQQRQKKRLVSSTENIPWKRPYKFLSYFLEEDEQIFFGRDDEKKHVFNQVAAHRLVVLHGASGAGKTSLLNAGVAPLLKREGFAVMTRRLLQKPEQEIFDGLTGLIEDQSVSSPKIESLIRDADAGLPELLTKFLPNLNSSLVIILDQFEEFFIRFPKKARLDFAAQIGTIINDRRLNVRFVFSLRQDFHSHLSELKSKIPDIFRHDFRLENLSPEGMARAMEAPAELAGLNYEPGLVDRILDDLGTVGSETPQLQILCDRLYDELTEGEVEFTAQHYDRLGGAKGILGSYLERYIGTRDQSGRKQVQEVLKSLVTSLGTKAVVSVAGIVQETGRARKDIAQALEQLMQARLVRKLDDKEEECFELSHEYLIEEIDKWFRDQDKALKRARELLRQEMINHERFGLLIAPSRMGIIRQHESDLNLNPAEKELLHKSLHKQRKKRTSFAALGLILIAAVLAGAFFISKQVRAGLCQGAERKLLGVWDPQIKSKVKKAFSDTGLPYASDTFQRISDRFDAYAKNWQAQHTQACEATHVHGEQSEKMLDLRMDCLNQNLQQLKALIDLFANHTDQQIVKQAVQAATALPSPTSCQDKGRLLTKIPYPEDKQTQSSIKSIQKQIARIMALKNAGKFIESYRLAAESLAACHPLGYPPLESQLLFLTGFLQTRLSRYADAEKSLRQAVFSADCAGLDEIRAYALSSLVFLLGHRLQRLTEAEQFAKSAEAAIKRLGDNESLNTIWNNNVGALHYSKGDYALAMKHYREALRLEEKASETENPDIAITLVQIGNIFVQKGEHEQAKQIYKKALDLEIRALGPEHPNVAVSLNNLGAVYQYLGKHTQAMEHFTKGFKIREKIFGSEHTLIASGLYNIGRSHLLQGQYPQAAEQFQRALQIMEKNLGPDHPNTISSRCNLGIVFRLQGQNAQATEYLTKSLSHIEKALGPEHEFVIWPLASLGWLAMEEGRGDDALQHFERVVTLCAKKTCRGDEEEPLSEAQFGLAKVLWQQGKDKTRAISLAQKAKELFQKQRSHQAQANLGLVASWLLEHAPE